MRVDLQHFEDLYATKSDPWGFRRSAYERRKYDITVASLPRTTYGRCFEPGCAEGALTQRLAPLCKEIIGMEASPTAAREATHLMESFENTKIRHGAIPEDWPDGHFDLVVLSEIGYYWDKAELAVIADHAFDSLSVGGHLIGVHWLGTSDDHILHGSEVHVVLNQRGGLPIVHHADEEFMLDIWAAS